MNTSGRSQPVLLVKYVLEHTYNKLKGNGDNNTLKVMEIKSYGWIDRWMDGWEYGSMDGWMDGLLVTSQHHHHHHHHHPTINNHHHHYHL